MKSFKSSVRLHRGFRRIHQAVEALEARCLLSADVLSYHNNTLSNGQNLNETLLTPGNVNVNQFGKRYSTPVDGQVYAQPLVVSNVNVTAGSQQGQHNVVYVATQHDSLYAIDGDSGAVLWKDSFINPSAGITSVPNADVGTNDINPEIGITSTPTIDKQAGFLYLAAKTKEIVNGDTANPHYVYRLHKIDIHSGQDTSVVIGDTTRTSTGYIYNSGPYVLGNGDGAITVNGQQRVYFNALRALIRSGLTLSNGKIYITSASHGDNGPYHGWVLGYDAATLSNTAALNLTPNSIGFGISGGGVWQAGGIVAVDPQGFLYVETGNGAFDTNLNAQGFPTNGDYGDSFVKMGLDSTTSSGNQNVNGWGLKVVDYFTPSNQAALSSADKDLGSGGSVILPDSVGSAAHPHLMLGSGKEGKLYLIDRDNMGKFDPNTDHVVQEQGSAINGSVDTPAYYNGQIYYVGGYGDFAKTFSIANGAFSTAPTSRSQDNFVFPGSTPSISANGSTNAIVWDVDRGSNQLRAYNAASYAQELWTSGQATNNRDQLGAVVKFVVPTVANGHVYVGTSNALVAYGPPVPPSSAPATPTNLTATAPSSIQINLAWQDNANNEDGYLVEQSTNGGSSWTQIASLGVNAQSYAVTGLQASTTYSYRVRAVNGFGGTGYSGYSNIATTTTGSQPPALDFGAGFGNSGSLLRLNGSAQLNGQRLEITNGGPMEAGSAFTTSTLPVNNFTTSFTFQLLNPSGDGMTFTLQGVAPDALGGPGSNLGYSAGTGALAIGHSIAIKFDLFANGGDPSPNTTGLFTNGSSPWGTGSVDLAGTPIDLHSGHAFHVDLTYDGSNLVEKITDTITNGTWSHTYAGVNIPSLIGAGGAYAGFTGGTGGSTSTQDILDWTYTPTATTPPAAASSLTVTPASGTQLNLSWHDNSNTETGFKIYRRTGTTGTFSYLTAGAANQTSYMDTALIPNTDYAYYIVATNSAGDAAPSNTAHALTPLTPTTASNLQAVLITTTQVNLTWQDNATNEDGYRVYRKRATDGDNQFAQIASLPANASSYNDTNLTPGTSYDYHVQAYNIAGYSDFAGLSVQTLPAAPTLTATAGTSQIALSWTASNGATSYNLYRSTTAGGEGATPLRTGLTGTTFADTGVTPGTRYYYQITAADNSGEGPRSAEVSAQIGIIANPTVTGRIFYNSSAFDGNIAAITGADTVAIAYDKQALLPGHTATFANYTSYSKGINGIIIDVAGFTTLPTESDLAFKVGNGSDPSTWVAAPARSQIVLQASSSIPGGERIFVTWADNAIQNQWLQVTVKANAATGLASDQVFYFGNAIGESGDNPANAFVNATDEIAARNDPHNFTNPAAINNVHDYNRDGKVDATDQILARSNGTNFLNALKLIAPPSGAATTPAALAQATSIAPSSSVHKPKPANWVRSVFA